MKVKKETLNKTEHSFFQKLRFCLKLLAITVHPINLVAGGGGGETRLGSDGFAQEGKDKDSR